MLLGKEDPLEDDAYLQINTLVGLEDQRWPEDFLARSTMALILMGILRTSGYFGTKREPGGSDPYTEDELFVGSLLLRHLQVNTRHVSMLRLLMLLHLFWKKFE